jgi:hypothetical protein
MSALRSLMLAGLAGISLTLATASARGEGADILMGAFGDVNHYGPIGSTHAYVLGSYTCNISSDAGLSWINRGTPGFAMNTYRLHDGRLMHIGLGNAKTACCVANSTDPICGTVCTNIGPGLRAGCRDHYSAGFNAGQSRLAPRSFMNPQTGVISTAYSSSGGDAIYRRMQINQNDITAASFPGALYFAESHYICTEDVQAGNDLNNASYQRVTFDAGFNMLLSGTFVQGLPAIYAWREHGGGVGVPDESVTILNVDVPGEGRFILGSKVIDNGDNTWRYEYAIYNFSSDRSGGGFHVPIPLNASVSNAGFNAPDYHSDDGALYSNADWVIATEPYEVRWNSPQTFDENQNTNALRWGSLYNFWFTTDRAPVEGHVDLDLFKPAAGCVPTTMRIAASVPAADCVGDIARDGDVNVDDLVAVVVGWGPCACEYACPADVAGGNNAVDVDDLVAVIKNWGACD